MRDFFDKYKLVFTLLAIPLFVYVLSRILGVASGVAAIVKTPVALALSLVFGLILGIFLTPILLGAFDAFYMFFFSPIFRKRWQKFKRLRRGFYSFLIIVTLFILSFFAEFLINNKAIFVKYQGKIHFTLFAFTRAKDFGMKGYGLPNYRQLKTVYRNRNAERLARIKAGKPTEEDLKYQKSWGDDWVLMPIYPYGPIESLLNVLPGRPPHAPTWLRYKWRDNFWDEGWYELPKTPPSVQSLKDQGHADIATLKPPELYKAMAQLGLLKLKPGVKPPSFFQHLLGTDDRGRDVFARMVYGFHTSLKFALYVTVLCYMIGITIGALLGYYGGKFDIIMQRFVEIWSAMPFLYTVMIIAAIMIPNFWMLVGILVVFKWMGMTYYIRGEFLREKSKDYVAAARAIGCTDAAIIFRHILPNALTPVISFAPFAVVANIGALVSLDFLGFGLPAPTPSWGELLGQGLANLGKPWLILSPMFAMFATLLLVSFVGEAIREAFDPKEYSRLR